MWIVRGGGEEEASGWGERKGVTFRGGREVEVGGRGVGMMGRGRGGRRW